eukprot:Pgem_evm1s15680
MCTEFRLQSETYFLSISIFDRMLSYEIGVVPSLLQLYGTAALSLATKFQERESIPIKKLSDMTLNACNPEDIIIME